MAEGLVRNAYGPNFLEEQITASLDMYSMLALTYMKTARELAANGKYLP